MTLGFRSDKTLLRTRLTLLLSALSLTLPLGARAGGPYLTPLGAEPTARAGARVAGVSDPHALWYNPAGIAFGDRQLAVDLGLPRVRASFQRFVDDGTREPNLRVRSEVLPAPTIAYIDDFGMRDFGFGVGLIVPPAYALRWPTELDGQPAPQRFSLLDMSDSAIGSLVLAAAYRPLARLAVGAALYITFAQLGGEVAVSTCDYAFCAQPEAREWEGRSRFLLGPVVTASAIFGARYDFDRVRVGGSVQVRTQITGDAQFDVLLPDQFLFDDVRLEDARGGDDLRAEMTITLPTIVRLGIEVDVMRPLTLELAGSWENWSRGDTIDVRPKDVIARDVPALGDVKLAPLALSRNLRDSWALHLGGSHDLSGLLPRLHTLLAHAGVMLETGSVARRDLSPTTLDTQKLMLAAGVSVALAPQLLLDVTYAHAFMRNHTVRDSRVRLPSALRPTPVPGDPSRFEPGDPPRIGNGRYTIEADYVALGLRWLIGPRAGMSARGARHSQ